MEAFEALLWYRQGRQAMGRSVSKLTFWDCRAISPYWYQSALLEKKRSQFSCHKSYKHFLNCRRQRKNSQIFWQLKKQFNVQEITVDKPFFLWLQNSETERRIHQDRHAKCFGWCLLSVNIKRTEKSTLVRCSSDENIGLQLFVRKTHLAWIKCSS